MPHELPLLNDLLILLIASIPIAYVCSRLRLPVIAGFMLTGVLIGPYGLGLIREARAIEGLAEIGVVLLLFAIGLEFSFRRILEMRRLVFLGGGLQVALTALLTAAIAWGLGRGIGQAIFFGFLLALSSTALVFKSYMDRAELNSPHGRAGVGILLFQDLCVVPMMLLVPVLSGTGGASAAEIIVRLGAALAAVAAIIFTARIVVPRALFHVVRLRSPEVFIIFVVLVSLGTSWLTAHFGLSLALGAFIAGLVLSESEYSHQIVADILPFRDVFNSVFFISIGMLLSVNSFAANALTVLAWVVALIIGKALIVLLALRLLGYSLRVATMAGVGLAQVGEFSFILAKVGMSEQLLSDGDYQTFLAAAILSMMATPFLIKAAPRIGYAVQSLFSPDSLLEPSMIGFATGKESLIGHIVIVGYGLNGHNLARVLRRVGIPYIVLDLNPEAVRAARAQGETIEYGDATRKEVLHKLSLERARILVLAISDPIATRRAVKLAREMNPDIHIIVRTRYMSELPDLHDLGADQVIPEEFETSVEIFSRVLREYGIARNIIQREVEAIRREGYQMLRAPVMPVIETGVLAEALGSASTETVMVEAGSPAVGRTLKELDLRGRTGATVITAIRDGSAEVNPGPEYRLAADDTLVLLGSPEQIERAIEQINPARADS
ncbi:MAG TPA: cation:proton antiporter [Blastocatellia bacterium]|nr:cation:proton antiporter [Blastocatellia bacterium]